MEWADLTVDRSTFPVTVPSALYDRRQAEWLVQSTPTLFILPAMTRKSTDDNVITKWGYRLVLLWFAYTACQWLDKIKVRSRRKVCLTTRMTQISRF